MENKAISCHLPIISGFSPYLAELLLEVGGDSLILPDFTTAEVFHLMNLIYSGK